MFGYFQLRLRKVKYLAAFNHLLRHIRQIPAATASDGSMGLLMIRVLHHLQGLTFVSGLASSFLAFWARKGRLFAQSIARWWPVAVIAILFQLSFQLLDPCLQLLYALGMLE